MTTRRKMCQIKGISEAKMEKIKVKSMFRDIAKTAKIFNSNYLILISSLYDFKTNKERHFIDFSNVILLEIYPSITIIISFAPLYENI